MIVCTKCGYSKSGISSDNIRMCLDCGNTWPTQHIHYSQTLRDKITMLEMDKKYARKTISDLFVYMQSEKFHNGNDMDNYVCVDDVYSRLRTALSLLSD